MKFFLSLPTWARIALGAATALSLLSLVTEIGRAIVLTALNAFVFTQLSLGFFEAFTKPFAIRRSQGLILGIATHALQGIDKVFPAVIAEGLSGDELRERVRVYLKDQTDISWDRFRQDLEAQGSTLEEGVERGIDMAQKLFKPEVLLNKLLKG